MAADLHIHVIETEQQEKHCIPFLMQTHWCSDYGNAYEEFWCDGKWVHSCLLPEGFFDGWEDDGYVFPEKRVVPVEYDDDIIWDMPSVWVGEVSWLKASIFDDSETYVPDAVMKVAEVVGRDWRNLRVIDDTLIAEVKAALDLDNTTMYSVSSPNEVIEFLERYRGKKVFHVSW